MKKFLFPLVMLLCILLPFSIACADELPVACPDCGNTNLGWLTITMDGSKDAHGKFCEPCHSLVGGLMEVCTPVEGSATCVNAPLCKVCGYPMSMTLQPDTNAHSWRDPQYWWDILDGATEEGFPVFACTAAYEYSGEVIPFGTTVSVSLPLSAEQFSSFELLRVDVTPATETAERTEVRTPVEFTFENDLLTFEADAAALYLLIAK